MIKISYLRLQFVFALDDKQKYKTSDFTLVNMAMDKIGEMAEKLKDIHLDNIFFITGKFSQLKLQPPSPK